MQHVGTFLTYANIFITYEDERRSRDNSVSIATSLWFGGPGFILGRGKYWIIFFTTAFRSALGSTQPPTQWVSGALSLEVKRPEVMNA
jgi:hypothetical protein